MSKYQQHLSLTQAVVENLVNDDDLKVSPLTIYYGEDLYELNKSLVHDVQIHIEQNVLTLKGLRNELLGVYDVERRFRYQLNEFREWYVDMSDNQLFNDFILLYLSKTTYDMNNLADDSITHSYRSWQWGRTLTKELFPLSKILPLPLKKEYLQEIEIISNNFTLIRQGKVEYKPLE